MADDDDRRRVAELLGRNPDGEFDVVVRDAAGDPVVIRNAPLLPDGRPMPTRYWLVGSTAVTRVSRLEAGGGVRAAEAAVDPAELADAHDRYAAERDRAMTSDAVHRPTGGVGGTRQGVKCLHAHYAWHLAGGDDPVGRWIAEQLTSIVLTLDTEHSTLTFADVDHQLVDAAPHRLVAELTADLGDGQPPAPESLTNAVGLAADDVDELVRTFPELLDATAIVATGTEAWHLATVEHGAEPASPHVVERGDLEALFRTLATESRRDRAHNPGVDAERVDAVLATCCLAVGALRRLQLRRLAFTLEAPLAVRSRRGEAGRADPVGPPAR